MDSYKETENSTNFENSRKISEIKLPQEKGSFATRIIYSEEMIISAGKNIHFLKKQSHKESTDSTKLFGLSGRALIGKIGN